VPVFIELVTEAFEEVRNAQRNKRARTDRSSRAGRRVARRPTRGLEIKDDTAAALKVILADGTELPLVDSSSPDGETTSGYANFILQSVQEQRMEKHQIVETFGASYIFFFGESPRFLSVQAVLVNSHDFNWEAEWWENYDRYLRGTKLVELGGRLYMFYDDNIVEGYMLNTQASKTSDQPFLIQMNFTLFVTNSSNVSMVGSPQFPVRASAVIPPGVELTGGRAAEDIWSKYNAAAVAQQEQANIGATGEDIRDIIGAGTPGQGRRLSAFLRQVPASLAIAPDVQAVLNQLADQVGAMNLQDLVWRNGAPIRSLIANNTDEYVGGASPYWDFGLKTPMPTALAHTIRTQQESDNLFYDAISFLSCFGADINSYDVLQGMGFAARIDATAGATFRPQVEAPFGYGLSSAATTSSGSRDPLGFVYGGGTGRLQNKDNRYVQGAGDPYYGFYSDFAAGPGFGRAGLGNMGGAGYGGALGGAGDPGFRDPRTFTYAGVQDTRSAFQRFMQPRQDASRFGSGIGLGASTTGLTGSASFSIGGKVSAFSLVAVSGSLDFGGSARSQPQNISNQQQQQMLGYASANPFGATCADPSTGGFTLSTGNSFGVSVGVSANLGVQARAGFAVSGSLF
jgi:hypothetical protein